MKLPRDVDAKFLIRALLRLGYKEARQTGSHIRLTLLKDNSEYHITIPNHNPIKIGTLNSILKEVSLHLNKSKDELVQNLF